MDQVGRIIIFCRSGRVRYIEGRRIFVRVRSGEDRKHRPAPAALYFVQGKIDGDTGNIRADARMTLKIIEVAIKPDKDFLTDVIRIGTIAQHADNRGSHAMLITLYQRLKGMLAAVLRCFDQFRIRQSIAPNR